MPRILHAQQLAELLVGCAVVLHLRLDDHHGDAQLLLHRVEVLFHAVFDLAGVDEDLRTGCGDGLLVEVAFRSERGSCHGQVGVVGLPGTSPGRP